MEQRPVPSIVLDDIIEQAATEISTLAPGTLITHDTMANMLDNPPQRKYYDIVRGRLSKVLMKKYRMLLKTEVGKGYLIPHTGQEYEVPEKRVVMGCNQINRAATELSFINTDKMTALQAKNTIDMRNKVALLESTTRNAFSPKQETRPAIPQITRHDRFQSTKAKT